MTRTQLLLIFGALALAIILYFFTPRSNTSIEEGESPETRVENVLGDLVSGEEDALSEDQRNLLDSLLLGLREADDSTLVSNQLNKLVLFWQRNHGDFSIAYWMDSLAEVAHSNAVFQQLAGLSFIEASSICPDSSCLRETLNRAIFRSSSSYAIDSNNTQSRADELYARVQLSKAPMREIVALRTLADKEPGNLRANLYMGQLSIQSAQFDKAELRFRKVIEQFPAYLEARFGLAESLYKQGKEEEAIKVLEDLKALSRDEGMRFAADQILNQIRNSGQ